ncbi:3'(2'),5'-bisphosphate nucleotidase [bacterium]|nr:3'(2'),5'-bisphosphate nucleotidase [bacterium]
MSYDRELEIAVSAVLDACKVCQTVQANLVTEDTLVKKDRSPVTVADMASQAIIIHSLSQAFPNDPFVGEETAADLKSSTIFLDQVVQNVQQIHPSLKQDDVIRCIDKGNHEGGKTGRFWTIDPIDGTKGFLRKDQYAIALALIENGEVQLGLLGCPNLPVGTLSNPDEKGCVFIAGKDSEPVSRRLNDEKAMPLRVSEVNDISLSVFCESVESGHSSHSDSQKVAEMLGIRTEPVRIDSQCKYATVARGEASIYLRLPTRGDYQEKIWDHAAGAFLVESAGGKVTDIYGKDLDFSCGRILAKNKGVIATNGTFHEEVLKAVQTVLGI